MKWEDLTPEQRDEVQKSMIIASKAIIDAFESVFAAMQPALNLIKEFYDELPKDIKEQIAALQVEEKLQRDNIQALKVIDPKKAFIAERLKEYSSYWDEDQKLYVIEHDWTPTREELIESIEKSWEFEHES